MEYRANKLHASFVGLIFLLFYLIFTPCFSASYSPGEVLGEEIQSSLGENDDLLNIDETIFPDNYPEFLKQAYLISRQIIAFEKAIPETQEKFLEKQTDKFRIFFRDILANEKISLKQLCLLARMKSGQKEFEKFLDRFGINQANNADIELEILAQIDRMRRRESVYGFVKEFDSPFSNLSKKVDLVKSSTKPVELEYALANSNHGEFEILREITVSKENFGPQTEQDQELLDYLESNRLRALRNEDYSAVMKWQKVISQLISQQVGSDHSRLPFSKWELFAMMRNAERTLDQRTRPFIDITEVQSLNQQATVYAREMIRDLVINTGSKHDQEIIAYGFMDNKIISDLKKLKQIYEDILNNNDSGQCGKTKKSLQIKKNLLELIEISPLKDLRVYHQISDNRLQELVKQILKGSNESYRLPFIKGIILLKDEDEKLAFRFIEDFPMIVAGETYPYQWKHDNEVNIALLLANVDPYNAAQAVRFIIYYGMWRSDKAKDIGMYGWIPQIIFGDRQTGKLPEFNNRIYYYFPDFTFRPTKAIDEENERNRTSEIMQLPFFAWTVWRVYEEMKNVNQDHALDFLTEVYPYVRANTEAIRTALDPYNEGVLSGRDAWVNGMDNAWYHVMVMSRHLPERLIPKWSFDIINGNRVDNRIDKKPGNPVDPQLAKGRPSDYYYAFKTVFYDTIDELGLEPTSVYHASPYNAKDVAITSVMACSLGAQIAMAKTLKDREADIHSMSLLRNHKEEGVKDWGEEIDRYQSYLERMKRAVNLYLWSPEDYLYFNRDVTQMFPSVIEQQLCYVSTDKEHQINYQPRMDYWNINYEKDSKKEYLLNTKAKDSIVIDDDTCSVWMDSKMRIHFDYVETPKYWLWFSDKDGKIHLNLDVKPHDPFIVEQFCSIRRGEDGTILYEPDEKYWVSIKDERGNDLYELNDRAKKLIGKGARKIEDGDLLRSPAIASFFPLFGHIPTSEQAFQLAVQVVNPWMWWPENGIPIPTQPMMVKSTESGYIPNDVYDPDMYWRGPTWMSSTKPVIDGFCSYGYEMLYIYLVSRSIGTLQDGRAVEHWNPETGEINTSNINFPWAASCMAGSIWMEMTNEEQNEYLENYRANGNSKNSTELSINLDKVIQSDITPLTSCNTWENRLDPFQK